MDWKNPVTLRWRSGEVRHTNKCMKLSGEIMTEVKTHSGQRGSDDDESRFALELMCSPQNKHIPIKPEMHIILFINGRAYSFMV